VVAFNGLMEPGEVLANYLGKQRWLDLNAKGFAGKRATPLGSPKYFNSKNIGAQEQPQGQAEAVQVQVQGHEATNPRGTSPIPARPVWLDDDDIVYRHLLFQNFKGVLTYGSPLEKFAAIWPARVPVNKIEPHFPATSEWINIYDPIDPVSGVLRAFTPTGLKPHCMPPLINVGFAAHPALLYAHLRYLNLAKTGSKDLGDAIAHWVLGNRCFRVPMPPRDRWFVPYDGQHRSRWWKAALQWLAVYLLIGWIGSYFVCWAAKLLPKAISPYVSAVSDWLEAVAQGAKNFVPDIVGGLWMSLYPFVREFLARGFGFMGACALITLGVGIFASVFIFKRDPDDAKNPGAQTSPGKSRFDPEARSFGLISTSAKPAAYWARATAAIKKLMSRLRGK
jgi:hypothetical protein